MKFIKAGVLLVLLSAGLLVVLAAQVCESEQWAMVVMIVLLLGLLLVCIQVARTKRIAEPSLRDRSQVVPRSDRLCIFMERRKKQDGWSRRRH